MLENRRFSWLKSLLLAAPLACLLVWLTVGGVKGTFSPDLPPSPGAGGSAPSRLPAAPPPSVLTGFPPPEGDYPADRLFERVNGAADALIAAGCGRLLFWRMGDPAAEMELLIFDRAEGAARILARDAGPGRDPGPGEEASVTDQSVFFRRGRFYVRILGDPAANPGRERLLDLAGRADRGLPASDIQTSSANPVRQEISP